MKRISVPEQWRKSVCIIEDVNAEDVDQWFTEKEKERLDTFARPKRRAEWSASRLAMKLLAVENGLCDDLRACSVATAYRRPSLSIGGAPAGKEISITHSAGAGGAAVSDARIGIDLQKVRPLKDRATKFFLNEDEVETWRSLDLDHSLIHFWCAKEAGYKIHAARGWYRGVKISLKEAREDGLLFDYRDAGSEGTIETAALEDEFVLAVAKMVRHSGGNGSG